MKRGKYLDAYALIKEDMPFPSVTGRVCYHPCEQACNRGTVRRSDLDPRRRAVSSATSDRRCRTTWSRPGRRTARKSPSSDRVRPDTAPRTSSRASATRSRFSRSRRKPADSIAAAFPTGCCRRTCSIARSSGSSSSASRSRRTPRSARTSRWDDLKKNYDACVLAVGLTEPNSVRAEGEDKDGVHLRTAVPARHRHGHVEGEARRRVSRSSAAATRRSTARAKRSGRAPQEVTMITVEGNTEEMPACPKICTTCSRKASS